MSDILEVMRTGMPCVDAGRRCKAMEARSGCDCARAADEIERLRAALKEISDNEYSDPSASASIAYDALHPNQQISEGTK